MPTVTWSLTWQLHWAFGTSYPVRLMIFKWWGRVRINPIRVPLTGAKRDGPVCAAVGADSAGMTKECCLKLKWTFNSGLNDLQILFMCISKCPTFCIINLYFPCPLWEQQFLGLDRVDSVKGSILSDSWCHRDHSSRWRWWYSSLESYLKLLKGAVKRWKK